MGSSFDIDNMSLDDMVRLWRFNHEKLPNGFHDYFIDSWKRKEGKLTKEEIQQLYDSIGWK